MPFKYAAFTVMMPESTPQQVVSELKSLGYDGVEWRVHSLPNRTTDKTDFWTANRATIDLETIVQNAPDIRKLAEDSGLEILGLGTYLSCKLLGDVERCMEAAKIMGCGSIRVSPPAYDGTENYNDLYEEAVEGYARIEELARTYKVQANIELHNGRICPSASLAYRLVSNFDPDYIGVILDPGNMVCEGFENWQMGLELLGPYLAYVHVKNAAWVEDYTADGVKHWKTQMAPIKEGVVSWEQVLTVLDRVGYTGWLSLEDFAPGDTRKKLADGIAYLRSIEKQFRIKSSELRIDNS